MLSDGTTYMLNSDKSRLLKPSMSSLYIHLQYYISQKKRFPSESSKDVNPLFQNLASVVFVRIHFAHHGLSTVSQPSAPHCILPGSWYSLLWLCLHQTWHTVHITMSMFQVLNTAETERYKCFNFNQRVPGFKQTFNSSRVTAGTTACTFPAAEESCRLKKMLSRCLASLPQGTNK